MIVPMARIRVLGPRDQLESTLSAVQDSGVLQVAEMPPQAGVVRATIDSRRERRRRQFLRILEDCAAVLGTDTTTAMVSGDVQPTTQACAGWARLAHRERIATQRWVAKESALQEEQALAAKYREFLEAVQPLVRRVATSAQLSTRLVVVPAALRGTIETLGNLLRQEVGADFVLERKSLNNGDVAVLLVLPRTYGERLDKQLADARVPEVTLPDEYRDLPLDQAIPRMIARQREIPRLIEAGRRERQQRLQRAAPTLRVARQVLHDWLAETAALEMCALTAHAFTIEGWLPEQKITTLVRCLNRKPDNEVMVETIGREDWSANEPPVVLRNPAFFKPFELFISMMPLPRYGSIDPTPFVAVIFPVLFGMMLGDVGYGVMLAILAGVMRWRSKPDSILRTISGIAGPCAVFAIVFGVLFGEYFGDAAKRLFGFDFVVFDRAEAVVAALAVAIGIGVVHVVLGLILGVISNFHKRPRHALGSGVSALMVLLVAAALLATFEVLPRQLFTPAIVALLIAFPVLVAAEGLVAPMEFLATLGNVLSYARIMAIGTASVMLAVVANQMVGALGSTAIGLIFALLFHLVNFAIGLFTPAIHALRLHYVEFFGKFYSPGGNRYTPLGRWKPTPGR